MKKKVFVIKRNNQSSYVENLTWAASPLFAKYYMDKETAKREAPDNCEVIECIVEIGRDANDKDVRIKKTKPNPPAKKKTTSKKGKRIGRPPNVQTEIDALNRRVTNLTEMLIKEREEKTKDKDED